MTRYAIDRARNTLIAQWSTGLGDTATTVAELPRPRSSHDMLRLATCLTELSHACWRCYTHPASTAHQHGPGSLGRQREQEREAFSTVLPTLAIIRSSTPDPIPTQVEQAAHATGRVLRDLDLPGLATHVVTEVGTELAAIEQAERGDLTERAQQAVALTREDASPLHISQADTLLRQHPFGCPALHTHIEPTAAAIAAAHWLHAAVTVVAQHTGLHPTLVATAADQHTRATTYLPDLIAVINAGNRPRHIVMSLIRHTLHIAEGHIHGIAALRNLITAAEQLINKATISLPLTPIDPARPAPDLLERLLNGIDGCWRLYEQHATTHRHRAGTEQEQLRQVFLDAVRRQAGSGLDHLL